jgi:hypothetical protein
MPELFSHATRDLSLPVHFARAARFAIAGLILPPALLGAASMLGHPVRSGVEALTWVIALAGFAATGWMAGGQLPAHRGVALQTAAAFSAGGAIVTPAFQVLQGLSGRESVVAVVGGTVAGFAVGFGLIGAATAFIARVSRPRVRGAVRLSMLGGGLGGLLALVPYGWAYLGLTGPLAVYGQMAAAVIAILGCIIVPCRMLGTALQPPERDSRLHEPPSRPQ